MEDELLYEENFEEIDTDSELSVEDTFIDNPISKYQGTAEESTQILADDILSALEERGLMLTTESGTTTSGATTESGSLHGEYYDLLIQMNSHLEFIEEHLYEPVQQDVNTPINEYSITNMLLVGIMILLGFTCIVNLIKNSIFKLR